MTTEPISDSPQATVNPADPYERRAQTFPQLTDEQIERASEFGVVQALPKGTVLFERGDRAVDFFIVLEGSIEICEPRSVRTDRARDPRARTSSPVSSICSTTAGSWSARGWDATGQVIRIRRAAVPPACWRPSPTSARSSCAPSSCAASA